MAKKDLSFVIGIVKSREKYLVGEEKLARICEAEDFPSALKLLREFGFGGEEAGEDYERLLFEEEEKTLAFFREYYEGEAYEYLSLANDFHNAECAVREAFLGVPSTLKPSGLVASDALLSAAKSGNYAQVPPWIAAPMQKAADLFEGKAATGKDVGMIFLSAYYAHAQKRAKSGALKDALRYEIDAKNVATVLRAGDFSVAEGMLLSGGKLKKDQLALLTQDPQRVRDGFGDYGEYTDLVQLGLKGVEERSFVAFERQADSFSMKKMKERRYETEGTFPLLLYAFYKKAELANVRIVLVGKRGKVKNEQIKARLKEGYAG